MLDVWGKQLGVVNDIRGKLFQTALGRDKKTADLSLCLHTVSIIRSTSIAPTKLEAFGDQMRAIYR